MAKINKFLRKLLSGTADANISFRDLCRLLESLGFEQRIRGDHHIFTRDGIAEILNLQPRGGMAKPYQVKQVRGVLVGYGLAVQDSDAEEKEDDDKIDGENDAN